MHAALKAEDGDLGRRQFDVNRNLANTAPRQKHEDRHAHNEPEVLLLEDVACAQIPCLRLYVVDVSKNHKDPGEDETCPAGETMMTLEDTADIV